MAIVTVKAFKCNRCAHVWLNKERTDEPPMFCAKCKTAFWNKPLKK